MKEEIINCDKKLAQADIDMKELEKENIDKGNQIMVLTARTEEGDKRFTALMNKKLELEDILEERDETVADLRN